MTLGISALLSMTVFLMTIRESLPPTEKTPLISEYFYVWDSAGIGRGTAIVRVKTYRKCETVLTSLITLKTRLISELKQISKLWSRISLFRQNYGVGRTVIRKHHCTMGFHITFQEMEHIFFKLIL